MPRKSKRAEPENHERWLVSYSDLLTLLLAFFVVMFASSNADKGKAQKVSESVRNALEDDRLRAVLASILGGTRGVRERGNAMMHGPGGVEKKAGSDKNGAAYADLVPSLQLLNLELREEIKAGKMQVELAQRGLVVSLREAAFFPSGEDTISPDTYPTIGKVANVVLRLPNPVRLEGHTDSVPIHNSRFRSNWELSAARGIAMLNLLEVRFKIPRARLAVAGYAENAPVDSNDTAEGRAHNRRVDIVVLTAAAMEREPPTAPPPPASPPRR
ncbi:MAG: OmpA family protein [Acidobacteriales bacterium]|nr:OmpA family protein [Terriglobales bacterium]